MRNLVLGLSLAVALLVGCIIGGVGSQLIVPPVKAGTNPPKWEYKCVDANGAGDIEKKANRLGRAGFELVASVGGPSYFTTCFKRRLP